jgi:predicted transcriptional regulator
MSSYRRSMLQARILMKLKDGPVGSVTTLAEQVKAKRESVSRSLGVLKKQGIVLRDSAGWALTDKGREEIPEVEAALKQLHQKARNLNERVSVAIRNMAESDLLKAQGTLQEVVAPLMEQLRLATNMLGDNGLGAAAAAAQLADLGKSQLSAAAQFADLGKSQLSAMFGDSGLGAAAAAAQFADLGNSLLSTSAVEAAAALSSAVQPLLSVQEQNSRLFADFVASDHLAAIQAFIKPNNLLVAQAIDDIIAIQRAELSELGAYHSIDFKWAASSLNSVTQSFGRLIEHNHTTIGNLPNFERISQYFTVPTATTANYTHSVRSLVEAEDLADDELSQEVVYAELGDETLDQQLGRINPDWVEMRRGSWIALNNAGPDRLRHAGVSQRELLNQVLEHFVPNALLPDGSLGPQTKARVRIALQASKTDAEFIDTMAKAALSGYEQLNKYTHRNQKHEESLRAILRMIEGLIRFILTMVSS